MLPYYTPNMPNTSGIYCITCVPTGKIYIGSAVNLRQRRKCHFGDLQRGKHRNSKLQRAWNKHGEQSFTFEIVEFVLLPDMLTAREQYWFDALQPFGDKGFNLDRVAGSSLGRAMSQESREKSRATQLGRPSTRVDWHPTPEAIERHRQSLRGFKHTEETRRKVAEAGRGRIHSQETREKIRRANMGHAVSKETGAKIAAANKGRVATDETRARLSTFQSTRVRTPEEYTSRRKTLIVTSPDGVEYIVQGIDQFAKEHNLDGSALAKVARGKTSNHKGWLARFPDTSED